VIKNYFIIALKNLRKQTVFSGINILGLTLGVSCCFLIYLFLLNELSFDNFHHNGKNIYRVMRLGFDNGDRREIPYLSPPYAAALQNDFPDAIEQTVRISRDNNLISHGTISFNEKNVYFADSNFFTFFDFRLLRGDRAAVLKEPNSIVLTASAARKYFGKEDPLGKILEFNRDQQLRVTGIAEDVPSNSHLQFDMVVPMSLLRQISPGWFTQWYSNGLFTYVQLKPSVRPEQLDKLFPAFMDKYMGSYYAQAGFKLGLMLKPLHAVYFSSDRFDQVKHGSRKTVMIFMSIALLILVVACINFVNLATARATDRSREVGIRKVLGAMRKQLAVQFLFESTMYAALACILSLGIVQWLMPAYTKLLGYTLPSFWSDYRTYIFIGSVIMTVGLLAGIYPAMLLSSFSPIESLKGKLRVGKQGDLFRKSLVVFQFGISVLLVICVIAIVRQMNYMKTTDLGFDKSQTLIVRFDNREIGGMKTRFGEALATIPAVESVSLMSGEPGGFHDRFSFEAEGKQDEKFLFNTEFTDFNYVKTLGLKVIAGRDFSAGFGTDSLEAAIINRHAAVTLGYTPEQAVGKWIKNLGVDSVRRKIVGVVEDFHYASLKESIGQLVITPGRDKRLALVKLKKGDIPMALKSVKKIYASFAGDYPFEYAFLDERFNQLYKTETSQQSIMGVFSLLAILIACLGLFGLASYAAVKRTKEIGIRKVVGSSVLNIVLLLSRDLLKPVLLGTVIAIPAGYYLVHKWLEGFAYRAGISGWMFIIAVLIAVVIAFVTISFQAVRAAVANPVKSLRTE